MMMIFEFPSFTRLKFNVLCLCLYLCLWLSIPHVYCTTTSNNNVAVPVAGDITIDPKIQAQADEMGAKWIKQCEAGKSDAIATMINVEIDAITMNVDLSRSPIPGITSTDLATRIIFFTTLLRIIIPHDSFMLTTEIAEPIIKKNHLISHLFAMSPYKNSDDILQRLDESWQIHLSGPRYAIPLQRSYMCKQLMLVSARTHYIGTRINNKYPIFTLEHLGRAMHTPLCYWYCSYLRIGNLGLANEDIYTQLNSMIVNNQNDTYVYQWYSVFDEFMNNLYWSVSYIHPTNDRHLKYQINSQLQGIYKADIDGATTYLNSITSYTKHHIAVISQFWFRRHSVYRIMAKYARALVEVGYILTLYCIGPIGSDTDTSLFTGGVYSYPEASDLVRGARIASDILKHIHHIYEIIWYPAVGMSWTDIWLANHRLAPIQIATHGHSVSTHGSLIDYWISGAEVEEIYSVIDEDGHSRWASHHFSETLILIPGHGAVHETPTYVPKMNNRYHYQPASNLDHSRPTIINCPFSPAKVNAPFLHTLRTALSRLSTHPTTTSHPHVILRLFANLASPFQRSLMKQEISQTLGLYDNSNHKIHARVDIQIMGEMDYEKYAKKIEEGDFTIEASHYGGCNTVLDSLHVGQLVLTQPRSHWYNRIGAAILRATLPPAVSERLITHSDDSFIQRMVELIEKPLDRYRLTQTLRQHIRMTNILEYHPYGVRGDITEAQYFPRAIDYIRKHHTELQASANKRRAQNQAPYVVDLATEWGIRVTPLVSEVDESGTETSANQSVKADGDGTRKKKKKKKKSKTGSASPPSPDDYFKQADQDSKRHRVTRKNRPTRQHGNTQQTGTSSQHDEL